MDASNLLKDIRLMPVVTIQQVDQAVPLAEALLAAGIGAIEVTLRTEQALAAMQKIAAEVPGILLGAGSVRNVQQFAQIREAGCAFAVSPGATDALLQAAELPYVPGAATASECLRLLEYGYTLQKFFPAEASGGIKAIKSLAAPLPEVRFCPTGGINAQLAPDYLAVEAIACIGGSWFVSDAHIAAGDFAAIEQSARAAVELALG